MSTFTKYKGLEKPISIERYNIDIVNKNNDIIDSELHKLELKNESQDKLLATNEALNSEISRATAKENSIESTLNSETSRAQSAENKITNDLADEVNRATTTEATIRTNLTNHISNEHNPHNVTKAQVGLGNVDNTSDINKPVSTAQQNALSQAISDHNTSESSHSDMRLLISGLTARLNTLADSDDTTLDQLSEIVTYIKNNKSLIDGITTNKVNISDIIDSLTSTATNKPLSANQGKILNDLITTLTTAVADKVDKVSGKGLSTNDYTTEEKNKLNGVAVGAEANVQADWNETDTNSDAFIKNKPNISSIVNNAAGDITPASIGAVAKVDVPKLGLQQEFHYQTMGQPSGYFKIRIKSTVGWMVSFTINLYQSYNHTMYFISGYNYGVNHWYQPQATLIDSTLDARDIYFGYDSDGILWIGIQAAAYTGLTIGNINNGYEAVQDWRNVFEISNVSSLSGTIQHSQTIYRPWRKNETVNNAVNATNATNATNAVSATSATNATNADTVDGYHTSASNSAANTVVVRDSNAYTNLYYINSNTGNSENPTISQFIVTNGSDHYYRKASLAHVKSQLGIDELKNSVSNGKAQVASAITAKGVSTAADATFATMANNIAAIQRSSGYSTWLASALTAGATTKEMVINWISISGNPASCSSKVRIICTESTTSATLSSSPLISGSSGTMTLSESSAGVLASGTFSQILDKGLGSRGNSQYSMVADLPWYSKKNGIPSFTLNISIPGGIPSGTCLSIWFIVEVIADYF